MINYGIFANLIVIVLIILILTDWFDSIIPMFGTKKVLVMYLLLTLFLFNVYIPISHGWKISIGGFVMPILGYILLLLKTIKRERIQILAGTILLAASFFLLKELIRIDPILLIIEELYQLVFVIVFIVILTSTNLTQRIALILGGTVLGELLFRIHHHNSVMIATLGGGEISDIIWFALAQVLILYHVIFLIKQWARINIKSLRIR